MAKVKDFDFPLTGGKLNKKSNKVFRTRNGRQHSYMMNPSSVPPSKAQNAYRKMFGKVTSLVNAIMADPQQAALWDERRLAYNKSIASDPAARRYRTTRSYAHFVISAQLAAKAAKRRRKNPIPHALPKGLKLHIKHFGDLSTTELYEILKARFIVFYSEQNCRYLDLDDIDYSSTHLALHRKGRVIAYARLFQGPEPGQWIIGRLLTIERGQGFGKYIMAQAEAEAQRQGATSLLIHAQTQVVPFYESLGFTPVGDIFIEADIPHICMKKELLSA